MKHKPLTQAERFEIASLLAAQANYLRDYRNDTLRMPAVMNALDREVTRLNSLCEKVCPTP